VRGRPFPFSGFDAGVDLRDSAGETSMKFARDALNVTSRRAGIVETRPGCQQFNVAAPNTGNFNIYGAIIKDQPLLIGSQHSGTTAITTMLKAYTPGGTQVATQTLGTNGLAPQRAEWITAPYIGAQGPCYGLVQVQDNLGQIGILPRYFTATAFGTWTATSGTLPLGTMMLYHGNRVIIAGNPASPSTLYASDVGNPTDWDTTDNGSWAVDLDPADGEPITGIGTIGQDLLVFKRDKIFLVYGLDSGGENRRVVSNIGCVSHRSIVESPYGTFFLGPDGVYLTDGTQGAARQRPRRPAAEQDIVVGWRPYAAGAWFNDRYYLSVELYNFAGTGGRCRGRSSTTRRRRRGGSTTCTPGSGRPGTLTPASREDKLFGISSGTLRPPEYDVGLTRATRGNPAAVPNGYFQRDGHHRHRRPRWHELLLEGGLDDARRALRAQAHPWCARRVDGASTPPR
jgi:hypothetical protein